CGQGLNLILAAAAHPDSEFVGLDFLPEHIAHATELAQQCGLKNVRFIEGDFVALANDHSSLGFFDYAICHGITTWIAPAVKEGLFRLIGQCLKPGGLFYNSYNTYPGWLSAAPFQHLVLLEQRSKPGNEALAAAQASMGKLQELNAGVFTQLPNLKQRLDGMKGLDPAYLVQEYNNQFWQPVFVSRMMDDLAAVKLSYLGTATLPEAFDNALPEVIRAWVNQSSGTILKEQMRDYALNQSFRRDLYVKGHKRPWASVHHQALRQVRLVANPAQATPEEGKPWQIKGGTVELNGSASFYSGLWTRLSSAGDTGLTAGELMDSHADPAQKNGVMQALAMMTHAGWTLPLMSDPEAHKRNARAVNTALAQAALMGAPYRFACLPRAGTATAVNDTEWMLLSFDLAKKPEGVWLDEMKAVLTKLGRNLVKDGQVVTDATTIDAMLAPSITAYQAGKRTLIKRLGGM
ncbi:MAG: methyltransferase regulatory domain-containing protein, partial [Panacagrimonas sp.]